MLQAPSERVTGPSAFLRGPAPFLKRHRCVDFFFSGASRSVLAEATSSSPRLTLTNGKKGESCRCTLRRLLARQSHPDSSNEKMINRARD